MDMVCNSWNQVEKWIFESAEAIVEAKSPQRVGE